MWSTWTIALKLQERNHEHLRIQSGGWGYLMKRRIKIHSSCIKKSPALPCNKK